MRRVSRTTRTGSEARGGGGAAAASFGGPEAHTGSASTIGLTVPELADEMKYAGLRGQRKCGARPAEEPARRAEGATGGGAGATGRGARRRGDRQRGRDRGRRTSGAAREARTGAARAARAEARTGAARAGCSAGRDRRRRRRGRREARTRGAAGGGGGKGTAGDRGDDRGRRDAHLLGRWQGWQGRRERRGWCGLGRGASAIGGAPGAMTGTDAPHRLHAMTMLFPATFSSGMEYLASQTGHCARITGTP